MDKDNVFRYIPTITERSSLENWFGQMKCRVKSISQEDLEEIICRWTLNAFYKDEFGNNVWNIEPVAKAILERLKNG